MNERHMIYTARMALVTLARVELKSEEFATFHGCSVTPEQDGSGASSDINSGYHTV